MTGVFNGSIPVANALELTRWNDYEGQVLICENCGVPGCEASGWVRVRSVPAGIVLLPDFAGMQENPLERSPPAYFQRGIPLFTGEASEQLRELIPDFVTAPLPSGVELRRIAQWEAPGGLLGRFPDAPLLREEDVLYVSGDSEDPTSAFRAWLSRGSGKLSASPDLPPPVEFWIEGQPEAWRPLVELRTRPDTNNET